MANPQEQSCGKTVDRVHTVTDVADDVDDGNKPEEQSRRELHDPDLKSGANEEPTTTVSAYAGWSVEELRDLAEAHNVQVGKRAGRTAIVTALAAAGIEEPDALRRVHEVRAIPLPESEGDLVRELRQTVDSEFATAVRRGMLLADLRERCGGNDRAFGKKLKGYNLGIDTRQARRYRFLVEPAALDLIKATIFETGKPPSLAACEEAVAGRPTRTRTSEKKAPKVDGWSAPMSVAEARERLIEQVIDLLEDGEIGRKIKTAGSIIIKDTDTGAILGTIGFEPMQRPDLTATTRQPRTGQRVGSIPSRTSRVSHTADQQAARRASA